MPPAFLSPLWMTLLVAVPGVAGCLDDELGDDPGIAAQDSALSFSEPTVHGILSTW